MFLTIIVALGIIAFICAYFSVHGENIWMKAVPLLLVFIMIIGMLVVLTNYNDITIRTFENTTIANTTNTTMTYEVGSDITSLFDRFIMIFTCMGLILGLIFMYVTVIKGIITGLTGRGKI